MEKQFTYGQWQEELEMARCHGRWAIDTYEKEGKSFRLLKDWEDNFRERVQHMVNTNLNVHRIPIYPSLMQYQEPQN